MENNKCGVNQSTQCCESGQSKTGQACQTVCGRSGCACRLVIPVSVVLIGLVFLLGALSIISVDVVDVTWPILLVVIGLSKMCVIKCKGCK